MQEDDPENTDMPGDATLAADQAQSRHRALSVASTKSGAADAENTAAPAEKRTLSKTIKTAIFREVVLAKVREMKEQEEANKLKEEAETKAKSFQA